MLTNITKALEEIEIQYKTLVKEADINLIEERFSSAISKYNEALKIRPDDTYCLGQLKLAHDKKDSLKPKLPPKPENLKPKEPLPQNIKQTVNAKPNNVAPSVPVFSKANPKINGVLPGSITANNDRSIPPPQDVKKTVNTKPNNVAPSAPVFPKAKPMLDGVLPGSKPAKNDRSIPPPPPAVPKNRK